MNIWAMLALLLHYTKHRKFGIIDLHLFERFKKIKIWMIGEVYG